jgi:hypothetical protein
VTLCFRTLNLGSKPEVLPLAVLPIAKLVLGIIDTKLRYKKIPEQEENEDIIRSVLSFLQLKCLMLEKN